MSNEQSEWPRILHIAHCTLLIAHSGARLHSRTFMVPRRGQPTVEAPHEPSHPKRARTSREAFHQAPEEGETPAELTGIRSTNTPIDHGKRPRDDLGRTREA